MSCEEDAYVIDKLAKLLAEIAVIVNGPEPPLTRWSYHDLPEKVRALKEAPQPAALAVPEPPEGWPVGPAARAMWAAAQQPSAAVPDGYALVPVEPTQMMLDAAGMCIIPDGKEWLDESNREVWASMLAAALAGRVEVGRDR